MIKSMLTGCALALASQVAFAGGSLGIQALVDALSGDAKKSAEDATERMREAIAADPLLPPFLVPNTFTTMKLSPDGKHAAALSYDGFASSVVMIDTDTQTPRTIVKSQFVVSGRYVPHMRSARTVAWIANDLIAVNFNDGAAAFDLDGKLVHDLYDRWVEQIRDPATGRLTDFALIQREFDKPAGIAHMNVRTGENYSVDVDLPEKVGRWLTDKAGEIRVAQTTDTAFWSDVTRLSTWYRPAAGAPWVKIDERSINDDPFTPIMIPSRPGHLVVQARNGGDHEAIWDFDVDRKAFGEVMARHPAEDIVGVLSDEDSGYFEQVATDGLKPVGVWFDARMDRLQCSVDAALTGHINVLRSTPGDRMLVFSYSDVDPGRWYLLDARTMQIKPLAVRLAQIDPARMQPMRTVNYPARDGLSVPAYLTLPGKPTKPAPTIILIHGGPQERDRWQWDQDVQLFAAHGYVVFQPQFRGSSGFGKKFEEAGYGQWGLAMQDDITDGVRWLIGQNIADAARICIVGASYGGYATLWGLARTPELYKCGVSTAGVSDIENMLRGDSDFNHSAVTRELIRHRIGDAKTMAASFDAVSPLKHADRIVAPVLLVHGNKDERVPMVQSEKMLAALQKLHKDVKYVEFDGEGHGVRQIAHEAEWYGDIFALLERTIGKGEPPFPALPVEPPRSSASAVPAAGTAAASAPASAASR